jgi:hypothetical protein
MRRRLWWAIVLFDARMSELSRSRATLLVPTWDCNIPINVNDSDLHKDMKALPRAEQRPSECLFHAARSELANYIRHTDFHLDFTNPGLKPLIKDSHQSNLSEESELVAVGKKMEEKYFKFVAADNPLHCMTIWTIQGTLARNRLAEHFSRYPSSSTKQTDLQRDIGVSYGLTMLDMDSKVLNSPLTQSYSWLEMFYFPMMAYIHVVQDLLRRPRSNKADLIWETMSNNCEARFTNTDTMEVGPLFKIFASIVLQAWEAREVAFAKTNEETVPPRIVPYIKLKLAEKTQNTELDQEFTLPNIDFDDYSTLMSIGLGGNPFDATRPAVYPDVTGQGSLGMNPTFWPTMGWNMNP